MSVDISVVIPTFNRPGPLAETLQSVFAQDYDKLQVVVVDDSRDESARNVVRQFTNPRLEYLSNPEPSGGYPSRVRNLGAKSATGRFVHCLDDDDRVPAGLYRDVVAAFDANPAVGVVFGRVVPFGADADKLVHERAFFGEAARAAPVLERLGKRWPVPSRRIFFNSMLVCGAAMIRRECIDGIKGFDPEIRYGEDVDFYARAIRKYGGHFIDRDFLDYRIWENSIAHTPDLLPGAIADDFRKIQARYLREAGVIDYAISKLAARTLLRVL